MGKILWPWKMYAEYDDGAEMYFYGNDEDDCIWQIANAREEHGLCTYYTGVNDEDYIDGELREYESNGIF